LYCRFIFMRPLIKLSLLIFLAFFVSAIIIQGRITVEAQNIGGTKIAKWKDSKEAALSLNFDDSMISQAEIAVPELSKRGLTATFLVNPGTDRYQQKKSVWEQVAPANGFEIGNHTMHHTGAADLQEAEYEIGEAANIIRSYTPAQKNKLMIFHRGGGTNWGISEEEFNSLLKKYNLYERPWTNMISARGMSSSQLISFIRQVLSNNEWGAILFHGIEGEWLSITKNTFNRLLDYLVSVEDRLWIATYTDIYKYRKERETAQLSVLEASAEKITLDLTSGMDSILSESGIRLYDDPLTLTTKVPSSWVLVKVTQNNKSKVYQVANNEVQYEAIPGMGEITLTRYSGDLTRTGDLDNNGKVDVFDLVILLTKWNTADTQADLNKSGKVDIFDLLLLLRNWGPSLSSGSTPVERNGRLKVVGTKLVNEYGKEIQLRGVGTHGLQWFGDCINENSIKSLVKDWGADVIRLSMYPDQGGYEENPDYWKRYLDNLIEIAYRNGIYVIVDWHMGMQKGNGDPWYWVDQNNMVVDFFDYVSKKHGSKGMVLYELSNEPHDVGWEKIKSYAELLIPVIRKNDPEGIIIVASPDWAQRPDFITTPLTGDMAYNVMYSVHFYAEHRQSRRDVIEKEADRLPLFATEWGGYDSGGGDTIDYDNAQQWIDLLRRKKISWTHWAWCDGSYPGWPLQQGVCPDGPFTNVKPYGQKLMDWLKSPSDDF
jgi:endoglucanase